jgi:hypothetical protein
MRQGMSSPSAAAALVLLLALLAGGQCREAQLDAADAGTGTENYTASDAAVYWGPWQRARATWYGQPNGAGPDDNGERRHSRDLYYRSASSLLPRCLVGGNVAHGTRRVCARWRVRIQAHQPVPLHVHGLLRQPAIVQGRQGLRLLLQGTTTTVKNKQHGMEFLPTLVLSEAYLHSSIDYFVFLLLL